MGDLTKNFSKFEYACKDGCGFDEPKPTLAFTVQKIRDALDRPIIINSACRCEEHNREVGGVNGSQHVKGYAADLRPPKGVTPLDLFKLVKKLYYEDKTIPDLGYCKLYRTFVHVDTRPNKANNIFDTSGLA